MTEFSTRHSGRVSSTPGGASPFGLFAKAIASGTATRIRGDSPRTCAPVWRNSYYVGQIEDRVWKPINGGTARGGARWTAALLKAARAFELKTRRERQEIEPGVRNGELGEVGIAVLEYLYSKVDYATGRLDPAIRTIATDIGRAYSAVHNALKKLRDHGFLQWMRRSEPVEDPGPGDPPARQVSNAYALLCPEGMRSWLNQLLKKDRQPECEADRRDRERKGFEAMLAGLTAEERLVTTWSGDSRTGGILKDIAAFVDAREKQDRESSAPDETGGL